VSESGARKMSYLGDADRGRLFRMWLDQGAGEAAAEPEALKPVRTLPAVSSGPKATSGPLMFGESKVRHFITEGEPWFVAADVCRCLGLKIASGVHGHLVSLRVDERAVLHKRLLSEAPQSEWGASRLLFLGSESVLTAISESGLYKLAMRAEKATAKPFQDWVTREVLPSIRKTGSYSVAAQAPSVPAAIESRPQFSLPTTFSEALRELASEVEKREESERVAEALRVAREADAPKVEFVDNYVGLKGTSSLSDVGRMLGFSDPKAFCALLRPVSRSMAISSTSLCPRDVRK